MVVIICDSFNDACDAYDCFVSFIEDACPFMIGESIAACNYIIVNERRCIFVDYKSQTIPSLAFDPVKNVILDQGKFFDELYKSFYIDDNVLAFC